MLEVVLCVSNRKFRKYLEAHIDTIIEKNQLRWITIYTDHPQTIEQIYAIINERKHYIVIIDITETHMDVSEINQLAERKNIYICVVSAHEADAVKFINKGIELAGFLTRNDKTLYRDLINLFINADDKRSSLLKAIRVTNLEENTKQLVNYSDIYFIEKKKCTRYSYIYHKNGVGIVDMTIQALSEELPYYFYHCKASTIANLRLIKSIDYINRLVHYNDGELHCTFAKAYRKGLKNQTGM